VVSATAPQSQAGAAGIDRAAAVNRADAVEGSGGLGQRSRGGTEAARAIDWRRWKWPAAVAGVVLVAAVFAALLVPRSSGGTRLDPGNAAPEGSRAVAQVLGDRGVEVRRVTRSAEAARAVAGQTLVVIDTMLLGPRELERLSRTGADLVLVEPDAVTLEVLAPSVQQVGAVDPAVREPLCSVPAAQAAGEALAGGALYRSADALGCYLEPDDAASYVVVDRDPRPVTVIGQGDLLTNDRLADDGNAALALWTLGANPTVVWYVPDPLELSTGQDAPTLRELVPPAVGWVVAQLALVTVVVLLWRGRRLGPLVTEPLPVVVRAAETSEGRARLYRSARARGRAAATLRTATLRRLARRLDVGPDATPELVATLASAASGLPPDQVWASLLGAPPVDDAGLVHVATVLDDIERAVKESASSPETGAQTRKAPS
jgi:hypothetical protein